MIGQDASARTTQDASQWPTSASQSIVIRRSGGAADPGAAVPSVPTVLSVLPYFDDLGNPDGLRVLLEPGPGSSAIVATFTLQHRLVGSPTWTVNSPVPAADGAVIASGYASGDNIEMQVKATSLYNVASNWSATFTAQGATTPPLDPPAPPTNGSVAGGTGTADFTVTTPNDPLVAAVALQYGPNADGSGVTEIVNFTASANTVYSRPGEIVPAGTWYFFATTENSEGTPSTSALSLGQATVA